ncbi:hypothetical protein Lepto7376_1845 [[Leptolyngbya] sp. PCC 7376]|nr:hypothetical protein [[Leptolyngbya] sp. PCC 7376]AFY38170.1 hypothetical protein Lepto7376_1845 [[Leptolyngbya] sp. PCC 7376]
MNKPSKKQANIDKIYEEINDLLIANFVYDKIKDPEGLLDKIDT